MPNSYPIQSQSKRSGILIIESNIRNVFKPRSRIYSKNTSDKLINRYNFARCTIRNHNTIRHNSFYRSPKAHINCGQNIVSNMQPSGTQVNNGQPSSVSKIKGHKSLSYANSEDTSPHSTGNVVSVTKTAAVLFLLSLVTLAPCIEGMRCPERCLCRPDDRGRKVVECDAGSLGTAIPVFDMDRETQVRVISLSNSSS